MACVLTNRPWPIRQKRIDTYSTRHVLISSVPISLAVATPSNLAENQPTWQSSINHGGYSSRAVDGGLSPNWIDGSCIHTGYGPAIWAVDLSWIADVYYVKVLIRAGNPG